MHSHNNNYAELALGQKIFVYDRTFNTNWIIVGFDCEHNQVAADGTTYDNGYGIMLMPWQSLSINGVWGGSSSYNDYMHSGIHTDILQSQLVSKLKKVFGDHLIARNVLLSSSVSPDVEIGSTAYTWTTAYATLPSVGQLTGNFAQHNNKYDDGEANYKLPIIDYNPQPLVGLEEMWTRNVYGPLSYDHRYCAYTLSYPYKDNVPYRVGYREAYDDYQVRPLIYIR